MKHREYLLWLPQVETSGEGQRRSTHMLWLFIKHIVCHSTGHSIFFPLPSMQHTTDEELCCSCCSEFACIFFVFGQGWKQSAGTLSQNSRHLILSPYSLVVRGFYVNICFPAQLNRPSSYKHMQQWFWTCGPHICENFKLFLKAAQEAMHIAG